MYARPSASQMRLPSPCSMKRGVPPTARNARTGEFTPPGMSAFARSKSCSLRSVLGVMGGHVDDLQCLRFFLRELARLVAFGLRPEEPVGHHVAHARPEAGIE